jgi:hypothetical protein
MAEKNGETGSGPDPSREKISAGILSTVGWSLFLIWLGIVLLVEFSMGIVMLGVGGISLGLQMARKYVGLDFEKPWIAVGLIFGLVGLWELLDVNLPLIPLILVGAGIALLVSALRRKTDSAG